MDDIQKRQIVTEAKAFWDRGYPQKAGMLIFERIALEHRANWAANILVFAYRHIDPIPEIDTVLQFAKHPDLWSRDQRNEAHGIFDAVYTRTTRLSERDLFVGLVSQLAEHTAAIAYTSTQKWDCFDHSRGWDIADVLSKNIKYLQLDEAVAWQTLANERYILLDEPIICHRGCPICQLPMWDYLSNIKQSKMADNKELTASSASA